jgi:hypothetical protein
MGLDSSLVQDYDNHVAADALLTSGPTRKPSKGGMARTDRRYPTTQTGWGVSTWGWSLTRQARVPEGGLAVATSVPGTCARAARPTRESRHDAAAGRGLGG